MVKHIRFLVRNGRDAQRYIIFSTVKLSEIRSSYYFLLKGQILIYKVNLKRKDLTVYQLVIFYFCFLQGNGFCLKN